jgi:DNA-binding NtrC family response regulator
MAALIAQVLNKAQLRSDHAATTEAALGALADGRTVDVVFSDVMMPGEKNGVDLAREVHKCRPSLPMLLTSGYAEAAKLSAEAEDVCVLPKPYPP